MRDCGAATVTKAQARHREIDIGTPGDLFAEAVRRGFGSADFRDARDPKMAARLPPISSQLPDPSFTSSPSFGRLDDRLGILVGPLTCRKTGTISSEDISLLRAVRGPDQSGNEDGRCTEVESLLKR